MKLIMMHLTLETEFVIYCIMDIEHIIICHSDMLIIVPMIIIIKHQIISLALKLGIILVFQLIIPLENTLLKFIKE